MNIYALCDAQGTAMAEAAICQDHSSARHRNAVRKLVPMIETAFIDCTGNDELACHFCGATSETLRTVSTTIYYVGDTPQEAAHGMPFDDGKIADDFRRDNNEAHVYAVEVTGNVADFREVI